MEIRAAALSDHKELDLQVRCVPGGFTSAADG